MLGLWKSETDTYLNSTRSLSLHEQWSSAWKVSANFSKCHNDSWVPMPARCVAAVKKRHFCTFTSVPRKQLQHSVRCFFFFFFKFDSTWQLLRRRPLTINNLSCQILTCKAAGRRRVGVYVHSDVWKLYCTRLRGNRAQPNSQLAVPPRSTPHPLHAVTPDVVGACSSVTLKKALYWKDVIIRQKPPLSPCAPELILWAWEIDFSVKTSS